MPDFLATLDELLKKLEVRSEQFKNEDVAEIEAELDSELSHFLREIKEFRISGKSYLTNFTLQDSNLPESVAQLKPLAQNSRNLVKQADLIYKLASRLTEALQNNKNHENNSGKNGREVSRLLKIVDQDRQHAVQQLKKVRYFWKQANWLTERFPAGKLRNVEGLVKLVTMDEIAANDWSLTPGRYVGVTPEEVDEDFDFEETLREIHVELEDLNAEATKLAAVIKKNFKELGI